MKFQGHSCVSQNNNPKAHGYLWFYYSNYLIFNNLWEAVIYGLSWVEVSFPAQGKKTPCNYVVNEISSNYFQKLKSLSNK